MTNHDNLPVWAKILLDIPAQESTLSNHAEREEQLSSNKRKASPPEPAAMQQSIIVFGAGRRKRKWNWTTAFCPAAREANQ